MANSVHKDREGPDWPLGFISVAVPGTPVGLMTLVDSSNLGAPQTGTATVGATDYSFAAQQIQFQAFKPGASHGTQNNVGNIYIVRQGVGAGSGNRDDTGAIVATLQPGQTYVLSSAPMNRNVYSPYRYSIDGDNAGDGAFVTLLIG